MEDIRVAGTIAKLASALDSSKRAIVEKVELEKGSTDFYNFWFIIKNMHLWKNMKRKNIFVS